MCRTLFAGGTTQGISEGGKHITEALWLGLIVCHCVIVCVSTIRLRRLASCSRRCKWASLLTAWCLTLQQKPCQNCGRVQPLVAAWGRGSTVATLLSLLLHPCGSVYDLVCCACWTPLWCSLGVLCCCIKQLAHQNTPLTGME